MSLARVQRAGFEDELFASGGASGNAYLEMPDSLELLYRWRSTADGPHYVNYFGKRLDAIGLVRTSVQKKPPPSAGRRR